MGRSEQDYNLWLNALCHCANLKDGCLPVEGFLDALVRSLVVQIISAFFGALPFVVLVFLFYQLKGVRLSIRTGIFWSCLAIYFLLCIMVVCIFIASTSSSDGTKWFMTSTSRDPFVLDAWSAGSGGCWGWRCSF